MAKPNLYDRSGVVFRRIKRPSKASIEALGRSNVADIHEAMGAVLGYRMTMRPGMKPVKLGQRVAGPAITAFAFPGDNLMQHLALSLAEPGDVVVVNAFWAIAPNWGAGGSLWGKPNGIAGAVVEGAIRDTADIARLDFPVWYTSVNPGAVRKGTGAGAVNVPISCGGVVVNPGDVVVADDDGVIIVPREIADEIAGLAAAKTAEETDRFAANYAGKPPFAHKYAEYYKEFGMSEHDCSWDDDPK